MNRKSSFILAVFDLYRVYYYVSILIRLCPSLKSMFRIASDNSLVYLSIILSVLQALLIVSFFVSGVLYLFNSKIAYYMYFPQFILRCVFFMPTFGIILMLNHGNGHGILYKVLVSICALLELGRLAVTIYCLKKRKADNI